MGMIANCPFYSQSALHSFSRDDVLAGQVIRINPALITITDGLVETTAPAALQERIQARVDALLHHKVRTFHVDVNFPDYSGYGPKRPDINTDVFSPAFLADLNALVRAGGGFLNVHVLTDAPREQLHAFDGIAFGAICFQLEVLTSARAVASLVDTIWNTGACVSPVIETIGSGQAAPRTPTEVLALLEPALPRIGMLTLQAAGTAARSTHVHGAFSRGPVGEYIVALRPNFPGTLQIQGGVTTRTIGDVVRLGAEFLVCGTEIFHHPLGRTPPQVIDDLLEGAATALTQSQRTGLV
jgi:pentose-5-phosphate-3-epimerase